MNFGSECNSRTAQLGTVQIDRSMLRFYRNFRTYFTEAPSLVWYDAAALKPLAQFALVYKNNGLIVPLFLLAKANPKAPRYLSYLTQRGFSLLI